MLDVIFKPGKGSRVAKQSHGKYAEAEWKAKYTESLIPC